MTEKKKRGRPPKYEADEAGVAEMQRKIDRYFDECLPNKTAQNPQHPTVGGLALALDMDRDTLLNYAEKPEFIGTIKKAKQRVQAYMEQHLYGNNVTGTIFNLKNNFGWKDQKDHAVQAAVTITFDSVDAEV